LERKATCPLDGLEVCYNYIVEDKCRYPECGKIPGTRHRGLCPYHYGHCKNLGTLEEHARPSRTGKTHLLTNVDEKTRHGTCSVCGATSVFLKSNSRWYCSSTRNSTDRRPYNVAYYYKNKYGLEPDGKQKLAESQDNKCPICDTEIDLTRTKSHIDHNHETGVIRGVLCNTCNMGLGLFYENRNLLLKAVAYLDKHEN